MVNAEYTLIPMHKCREKQAQRRRLEDLIDWNGFEPNGYATANGARIADEDERVEDAVEN